VSEVERPDLTPGVWAEFASARRTIEWTAVEPKRIESARYTGAGLIRLFARISAIEGVHAQSIEIAQQLAGWWEGFDGGSIEERLRIIEESRSILDTLVPLGELGARRQDLSRRARLSKPSRRDRRPRKPEEDAEMAAKAAPDSASQVDSVDGDDQAKKPSSGGDATETTEATAEAGAPIEGVESTQTETVEEAVAEEGAAEPDVYAWLNLPATWPKVSPRPPRRLDWDHIEGCRL